MKRLASLCSVLAVCPALLCAGPIYGAIFFNGSALRGASISIVCPGGAPIAGSTLDDGSYQIQVSQGGRCTFKVMAPGFQGTASAEVVSLPNAARYNFVVVKGGNGGYELRRQ